MLTEHRLEALADPMDADRVLDAVMRGGLPLSLPQRVRLASSRVACRALMLRRLTELTFGPSRLSRQLTRELLAEQRSGGPWEDDPLATACAIAALQRVVDEHRADPAPSRAVDRGRGALAAMQDADGLFRGQPGRDPYQAVSDGTLILYLLDRVPTVWDAARRSDLCRRLRAEADRLPRPERLLLDMAHSALSPSLTPTPDAATSDPLPDINADAPDAPADPLQHVPASSSRHRREETPAARPGPAIAPVRSRAAARSSGRVA